MGFGQIRQLTDRLAEACLPGEQVVVLCGRNDKLKAAIERRHPAGGPVTAVGYTRRVADYMAGCAVIYTKPGGLTSTRSGGAAYSHCTYFLYSRMRNAQSGIFCRARPVHGSPETAGTGILRAAAGAG